MRATCLIGNDVDDQLDRYGTRVTADVSADGVQLRVHEGTGVRVWLTVADLDRLKAAVLAMRPVVPVDPAVVLAPEVGGEGG